MTIRLATFDPGLKNFAFYVEDCDINVLKEIEKTYIILPAKFKRRCKGPMNPQMEKILSRLFLTGKRVAMSVSDLRSEKDKEAELDKKEKTKQDAKDKRAAAKISKSKGKDKVEIEKPKKVERVKSQRRKSWLLSLTQRLILIYFTFSTHTKSCGRHAIYSSSRGNFLHNSQVAVAVKRVKRV